MENENEKVEISTENVPVKETKKSSNLGEKIGNLWAKTSTKIILLVIVLLIILGAFYGILSMGIYKLNWDNKFVNAVMKVVPFPAGSVDGKIIKLSDFRLELKSLQIFIGKQNEELKKQGQQTQDVPLEQMKSEVMDKLVNQALLEKFAKDYKIKDADIETELNNLVAEGDKNFGDHAKFEQYVKDFFGWDFDVFKVRLLRVMATSNLVTKAFGASPEAWTGLEGKANEMWGKLEKKEKTFAELATEYSTDKNSSAKGGLLGCFSKDDLAQNAEFQNAVFSLKAGETSQLLKMSYGYQVLKIEKCTAEELKAKAGTDTAAAPAGEQLQVSHILLAAKSFSVQLDEYRSKAKIKNFVLEK